jgi:tetratricopeptide (TPR) repeat protein
MNVDVLISSKTAFELDSLIHSCIDQQKSWEYSTFLKENNFSEQTKNLENTEKQKSNWEEEELKFEFGNSSPSFLDQFQFETNLFHFLNHLVEKVFNSFPKKFQVKKSTILEKNFEKEKSINLSKLVNQNDEDLGNLSFIYLMEKNYEKSQFLYQRIFEEFENVYISILLGLISIVNHKFKWSCYYFQKSLELGIPTYLKASCYFWIGNVYENLNCDVWAVSMYQESLKLINNSSEIFHWFVCVPFVHLRIGNIFQKFENQQNIEISKSYFL